MRFALYTKLDLKENNDHIFSVLKSLQKYKIDFDIDGDSFNQLSENFKLKNNLSRIKKLTKEYDYVVSIGGDGTILRSADEIGKLSIPIIGLNKGRLGFLANSPVEVFDSILEKIQISKFKISERSIIQVEFEGNIKIAAWSLQESKSKHRRFRWPYIEFIVCDFGDVSMIIGSQGSHPFLNSLHCNFVSSHGEGRWRIGTAKQKTKVVETSYKHALSSRHTIT